MPQESNDQQVSRQQRDHDRERTADAVVMEGMRKDMQYMRSDLSELKNDVRDLKTFYMTKEAATVLKNDFDGQIKEVNDKVSLIIKVGVTVLVAFTGAVAAAIAKLIFKV